MLTVKGLRIEKYKDDFYHSDDNVTVEDFERPVFSVVRKSDGQKMEISLWMTSGMCGSGYTNASWGHISIVNVKNFKDFEYVPKESLIIHQNIDSSTKMRNESDVIETNAFSVWYDGGDGYYPSGRYEIDLNQFKSYQVQRRIKKLKES